MPISLDIVPSTVRQAAELLASSLSDNEREYFRVKPVETVVGIYAFRLRSSWSLWPDMPIRCDAAMNYGIAHSSDVSRLIAHWARAIVVDEPFDPWEHCKRYHEHWASLGSTSLKAGKWKV